MAQQGNPFYVQPMDDLSAPLRGLGQTVQQIQAVKRQEDARLRAEKKFNTARDDIMAAYDSGDPDEIARAMIRNPQMVEVANEAIGFKNEKTRENLIKSYREAIADPSRIPQLLEEREAFLLSQGGTPDDYQAELAEYEADPEAYVKELSNKFAAIDPDASLKFQDALRGRTADHYKEREMALQERTANIREMEHKARMEDLAIQKEANTTKAKRMKFEYDERQKEIKKEKIQHNIELDTQINTADRSIDSVIELLDHPGLEAGVGWSSKLYSLPGSDKSNFESKLKTFDAQSFMASVSQLKGLGPLSDSEGKMVSASIGALNPNMSDEAFIKSLKQIKDWFYTAKQNLQKEKDKLSELETPVTYKENEKAYNTDTGETLIYKNGDWHLVE